MYYQQYNKGLDREVRQMKLISAVCLGLGLLIVSTLASYYWDLFHRAQDYDLVYELADEVAAAAAEDAGEEYTSPDLQSYDRCGFPPGEKFDPTGIKLEIETNWKLMFEINAIIYTIFTGLIVCSFAGLIYGQLFYLTINCMAITQGFHFVGLLATIAFRFNLHGKSCSTVEREYFVAQTDMNDSIHTWKEDGFALRCLVITQCVLFLPFCLCTSLGMYRGRHAGLTEKDRGIQAAINDDDDNYQRNHN